MQHFEERLGRLDVSVFDAVPSQSTEDDKRSLLACQAATREALDDYTYLEIGSYLGGSIQPHLIDPRCRKIYSIDKRPASQPDERGQAYTYRNNSTKRMMEALGRVEGGDLSKIVTIDGETSAIEPGTVPEKVDLCFIDGEHTDTAVISDFTFCLSALCGRGAIMLHDSQIIYNGIQACLEKLESDGTAYDAYILPHTVFVIEIGLPLHEHPAIRSLLLRNHRAYLFSLRENDHYRRFANRFPFRQLKGLMLRARGRNVCE